MTVLEATAASASPVETIGGAGLAAYLRQIIGLARALPQGALTTRRFQIAGQVVLTRFSDEARANLYASRLPAAEPGPVLREPEFHVDIIETTRLGWPAPARWKDQLTARDDFDRILERAGLRALPPHRLRLWEFMDRNENWAYQVAETRVDFPIWEAGAPLRMPLHWASLDRGRRLVHGATLGDDKAAILITGPGGTGKSGMTLVGIAHGLQTVGDDYVVIEPGNPPLAWQAYRLLKQDHAGIARLPGLAARIAHSQPNWQGKLEFDPEPIFPGCMVARQPIRAILVPYIGAARESRIVPMDRKLAFDALTRTTLQQFPSERASGFLFCAGLSKALPCFSVALSQDPGEIAATLQRFIEELGT